MLLCRHLLASLLFLCGAGKRESFSFYPRSKKPFLRYCGLTSKQHGGRYQASVSGNWLATGSVPSFPHPPWRTIVSSGAPLRIFVRPVCKHSVACLGFCQWVPSSSQKALPRSNHIGKGRKKRIYFLWQHKYWHRAGCWYLLEKHVNTLSIWTRYVYQGNLRPSMHFEFLSKNMGPDYQ